MQYKDLAARMFKGTSPDRNASSLETGFQQMIMEVNDQYSGKECMRNEASPMGKTFVCAVPGVNANYPRLFRTYKVSKNESANCTIWEAARATTADTPLFSPIEISEPHGIGEIFSGGALIYNNPSELVLDEAMHIWGISADGNPQEHGRYCYFM